MIGRRFEPLVVTGSPGRWDAQGGQGATDENLRLLEKEGIRSVLISSLARSLSPLRRYPDAVGIGQAFSP